MSCESVDPAAGKSRESNANGGVLGISRRLRLFVAAVLGIALAFALPSPSHWMTHAADETASNTPASESGDSADETQTTEKKVTVDTPFQKPPAGVLRKNLTRLQFEVTQNEATEPAFRNTYWDNKKAGTYECVVCELPLFASDTKYKSGTGWPSFYAPLEAANVGFRKDWRLFYQRTEVHCKRCEAHLGHVFNDGPRPTGKRYCMNSASMRFVPKKSDEDSAKE